MFEDYSSRRGFLGQAGMAVGAVWIGTRIVRGAESSQRGGLHLASNEYPWLVFYQRDGRNFEKSTDTGLGEVAASGMNGFEPMIGSPEQVVTMSALLRKHGLEMRSLYVNSTLHLKDEAAKSIELILAIGRKAKEAGTRIIVTNPNPIRWGGSEGKDDVMLRTQAAALEELGEKLSAMGLVLAYHNHDSELRHAAREFHHMMLGTDPKHVTLCLDAHWIYRGSDNSAVAVFDVLKLYGGRVSELHLRQSAGNIWTESFGPGDIDYAEVAQALLKLGAKPLLVMEQAVEQGTAKVMSPVEAHRRGGEYARRVFAGF